jgi:hypothetical protein
MHEDNETYSIMFFAQNGRLRLEPYKTVKFTSKRLDCFGVDVVCKSSTRRSSHVDDFACFDHSIKDSIYRRTISIHKPMVLALVEGHSDGLIARTDFE